MRFVFLFPHYLISGTVFGGGEGGGNYSRQNACFEYIYNFCQKKNLILRRIQRDIFIKVCGSSCKISVILVGF